MPSATPKVGAFTRSACPSCGTTHLPGVACPPPGRWLVSGQLVAGGRGSTVTPILYAPPRQAS